MKINSLTTSTTPNPKQQLKNNAIEFERQFLAIMLKESKALENKSTLNGGFAESVFQDFLTQEYAKMITQKNTLGIANKMIEQYNDKVK